MINITNALNPLWIRLYRDLRSRNDNVNVDSFTPEKPCVAGSM
ncbi:MAG TPA: hypothetical protein VIL99_05625 [Ignavibacteria bacterium]